MNESDVWCLQNTDTDTAFPTTCLQFVTVAWTSYGDAAMVSQL